MADNAHLRLTHHYGNRLAKRGRGGLLLVSSLMGLQGVPYMADYAAGKAFILSLGEALHRERDEQCKKRLAQDFRGAHAPSRAPSGASPGGRCGQKVLRT